MTFYTTSLGTVDGNIEKAFAKTFMTIPDGTTAIAKIISFKNVKTNTKQFLEVTWQLQDGDFKGQQVNQKIHCFEQDENKRFRALNMLVLLFKMFNEKPRTDLAPTDQELAVLVNKFAGIKIQQWSMPKDDGTMMDGNWVSEVHPANGFKSETGTKIEVVHNAPQISAPAWGSEVPPMNAPAGTDGIPF